jgi:hypothetical protein
MNVVPRISGYFSHKFPEPRSELVRAPASAHLCGKGLALKKKTTLPQTPRSAGSLRHWVRPFFWLELVID